MTTGEDGEVRLLVCGGKSPMTDTMRENIARAIAGAQWDRACSALGTPNYPRGNDWTRFLPEADAVLALYAPVMEENERLRDAVEPLALLAGGVNMNDPLRKWFTVAQLHDARAALLAKLGGDT